MIKNKRVKQQKRTASDVEEEEKTPKKAQTPKQGKLASGAKINNKKLANSNDVSSRKRKMESNKTENKKLKTGHQDETEEQKLRTLRISFPIGGTCYKDTLQKVINNCGSVMRPGVMFVRFASEEEAKKKSTELQKISVGDSNLVVTPAFKLRKNDPLRRFIYLTQSFKDVDNLKKFYDAKAVDQALSGKGNLSHKFILTFESEAKATAASKKLYNFGNQNLELRPVQEGIASKKIKKQEKPNANSAQKQNKKLTPNNQQQKKSAVTDQKKQKQNKQKQGKKKNPEEEEEEESDEDDDEGFLSLSKDKLDFKIDDEDDDDDDDDDDDGDEDSDDE